MNSLLHPEITPDNEFVLTPELNTYIVVLKVTPDQAAAFNSKTNRIGICIIVEGPDSAGVLYAYGIDEEGGPDTGTQVNDPNFNDAQIAVLNDADLQTRVHAAVIALCKGTTEEERAEHYMETQRFIRGGDDDLLSKLIASLN